MGEVYAAHDGRLDRTVALKILPPHVAGEADRRERFEREARTLGALSHPHLCPIFDVGEAVPSTPSSPQHGGRGERASGATEAAPVPYLVMEHLEGETLATRLARGALPISHALRYAAEIADALHAAHRRGITHRDLKPGNIFLVARGVPSPRAARLATDVPRESRKRPADDAVTVKLLDFGLARLRPPVVDAAGASGLPTASGPPTAPGTILGTLPYMAPEQLEGKPADERSDLFAFGAVLYEMVTGRRAFEGQSPASIIGAIMSSPPPAVSSVAPLSPPALDHLVTTCLAKDPDERWQSAADVKRHVQWIATAAGQQTGSSPSIGQSGGGTAVWRWAAAGWAWHSPSRGCCRSCVPASPRAVGRTPPP